MKRVVLVALAAACGASAYVPFPFDGPPTYRTDFASIQFLVNQNIAAGMMTSDGKVWITADSNPLQAIAAAFSTWNAVTTTQAHFAALQSTTLSYNSADNNNVITFTDDAFSRSLAAGILAATGSTHFSDGRILGTWRYTGSGAKRTVTAEPFTTFPDDVAAAIAAKGAALPGM